VNVSYRLAITGLQYQNPLIDFFTGGDFFQLLPDKGFRAIVRIWPGNNRRQILDDVPVVAYYFSASWCPPCQKFTPLLIEYYKKWNANEKKIEIVFISADRNETGFKGYYDKMPWLAIPYGDRRIKTLSEKFEPEGIPNLIIVSKDEKALTGNGYEDVMLKKDKTLDYWSKL